MGGDDGKVLKEHAFRVHLQVGMYGFYLQSASLLGGEVQYTGNGVFLPADVCDGGVYRGELEVLSVEVWKGFPIGLHIIPECSVGYFYLMYEDVPVVDIPFEAFRIYFLTLAFLFWSGGPVPLIVVNGHQRVFQLKFVNEYFLFI